MEEQYGEDEALLDPPERDRAASVEHLERTENPVLHIVCFTASRTGKHGSPGRVKATGCCRILVHGLPRYLHSRGHVGPRETNQPTDVSFHGEVWTDARGHATVSLPRDADLPQDELEYELQPIDGESRCASSPDYVTAVSRSPPSSRT